MATTWSEVAVAVRTTSSRHPSTRCGAPTTSAYATSSASCTSVFPATRGGIWRGSWASFYDFTPDGNPVVDRVPGRQGLLVATGGSGHAFKLAPALGLGAAELVCDGDVSSFDWSALRFGRFA